MHEMGDSGKGGARVAVIGSGITGLSAAWLLHRSVRECFMKSYGAFKTDKDAILATITPLLSF